MLRPLRYLAVALLLMSSEWGYSNDYFRRPNIRSAPGTFGTMFLTPVGGFVHAFNNDAPGATDKLLTGAFQIGRIFPKDDALMEFSVHWRAVNPIFKVHNESKPLKQPIGKFADWLEATLGATHLTMIGNQKIRYQLAGGFSHIGNKGMKRVHREIHEFTNQPLKFLEYEDQPDGFAYSLDGQLGLIYDESRQYGVGWQSMINLGYYDGPIVKELYLSHHTVAEYSADLAFSLELTLAFNTYSDFYPNVAPLRNEIAFGVQINRIFSPAVKFASPVVQGDPWGQVHLSLLNFNFQLD